MKNLFQSLFGNSTEKNESDLAVKEVGDKVKLCAENYLGYFIDVETDQQLTIEKRHVSDDIKALFLSKPMIVVANNLNKIYQCGHCTVDHKHDIIVYIPAMQKRYFTSSVDVKHVK